MSNVLQLKNPAAHYLGITIKHSPAELGRRGQRQAGVVKLVTIVTDADLKLDGIINVLEERGWVKLNKDRELPFSEKFLWDNMKNNDGRFVYVNLGRIAVPPHLDHQQVIWWDVVTLVLRFVSQFCGELQ